MTATQPKEMIVSDELYDAIQTMAEVESSRMDRVTDHSMEVWSYDDEVSETNMEEEYAEACEVVENNGFEVYYRIDVVCAKGGEVVHVRRAPTNIKEAFGFE